MDGQNTAQAPNENLAKEFMYRAFEILGKIEKTRELSLAITNLEQGMMWLNKHMTVKGLLTPTQTHVPYVESNKNGGESK